MMRSAKWAHTELRKAAMSPVDFAIKRALRVCDHDNKGLSTKGEKWANGELTFGSNVKIMTMLEPTHKENMKLQTFWDTGSFAQKCGVPCWGMELSPHRVKLGCNSHLEASKEDALPNPAVGHVRGDTLKLAPRDINCAVWCAFDTTFEEKVMNHLLWLVKVSPHCSGFLTSKVTRFPSLQAELTAAGFKKVDQIDVTMSRCKDHNGHTLQFCYHPNRTLPPPVPDVPNQALHEALLQCQSKDVQVPEVRHKNLLCSLGEEQQQPKKLDPLDKPRDERASAVRKRTNSAMVPVFIARNDSSTPRRQKKTR